ncbi:hypothetical protein ITG09_09150 [Vibrio cyclitrophicus]|nr:hypothetical protein [Vibrio cyclitrophicus]UPR50890.1 hypothetical protein ITG09_09150 [Vibrio cyclitrophicus]
MNTTERIHALLEDRSFPSMVLLDGHWGVGKTYYVKNELQPYLKTHYPTPYKTIYLSLYGVTSLEDFKDRVLSLTYTENKKSSWLAKHSSDLVGSSAQVISGTRGVGAALGGVASIVKYHYFNKIDNLVLLLDDLERITCEKVRTQVMGECLNLAENKQHIKIVVIGNQDKIGNHEDLEKAFSDIVHLKRTPFESLDVIKKIYTGISRLSDYELSEISKCLKSLELDNLRIIRRAIDRYKAVCSLFDRVDEVNYDYLESKLMDASFRISTAIHREGFSLDEILKGIEDRTRRVNLANDKVKVDELTDIEKRHLELETYVSPIRYHTPQSLSTYIATYQNNFYDIHQELNIPTSTEAIELFLGYGFRDKDEHWFQQNIGVLKKEVFEPNVDNLLFWIRCCGLYFYMLTAGYVKEQANTFRSKVTVLLKENDFSLDLDYRDLEHDLHTFVRDDELNQLFRAYIEKFKVEHSKAKSQSFVSDFISDYSLVRAEIDVKLAHTAFLQNFTSEDFKTALSNWSSKEIQSFIYDMQSRYDFNNIDDYFSVEFSGLVSLSEQIQLLMIDTPYGIKRGSLSNLDRVITGVITRLETKINAKLAT